MLRITAVGGARSVAVRLGPLSVVPRPAAATENGLDSRQLDITSLLPTSIICYYSFSLDKSADRSASALGSALHSIEAKYLFGACSCRWWISPERRAGAATN